MRKDAMSNQYSNILACIEKTKHNKLMFPN